MVSNYRVPPSFDEGKSFESWKNEVAIWTRVMELDTACLDMKDRQLALTACTDLTFTSMKSALERIFGGKVSACSMRINQETAYITEQRRQRGKSGQQKDHHKTPMPGTNPLDRYGRRSKCAVCRSTFHRAKDCPHRSEQVKLTEESNTNEFEEWNITLYTKDSPTEAEIFMTECFGSAIIDTACTRPVCGQEWLDDYVTGLSQNKLNDLIKTEEPSCRSFRFGDGKVVYSTKKLKIPAKIGQTSCHIETDVVPTNIPLLLSKASMKRAGTVLDMEEDRAVMFNKPVKLDFTSSGHYCVNIMDDKSRGHEESQCENEILIISEEMSSAAKRKILLKLHKQFGHASAEKLQRLLKSAGNKDTECDSLLIKIVSECEICQR